uniref:Leucine rich repeat protein n=1 Tax=Marseillevirus LCMAC201 TaxID=2506605 RepID=A0A481YX40_9VIRU|nr:MAG: uncharacterized protein LCMAC201_03570 [Marseillevirus LCMAC201]
MEKCLLDINFEVVDGKLNCSYRNLTSLKGCPNSVTHLDCIDNKISSFKYIPDSVIHLSCGINNISSFEHLPNSVKMLNYSYNNISSFKHLPNSITELYCANNNISSFKYLPNSITYLYCCENNISSFKHLPNSITSLSCSENPIYGKFQTMSLKEIHLENYITNPILNHSATVIQQAWDNYWYKPDITGESKVAKYAYNKFIKRQRESEDDPENKR